jgi:hypothetical protein
VVDPEMRHGHKSHSRRIDGYKSHVITDHDSELVLGVAVTAANEPDGPQAAGLVAGAKALGVAVSEVLGDTAYGDGDTRVSVEQVGAKVIAKTVPTPRSGLFLKTDFSLIPSAPPRPVPPVTPPPTGPGSGTTNGDRSCNCDLGRAVTAAPYGRVAPPASAAGSSDSISTRPDCSQRGRSKPCRPPGANCDGEP